MKYTLLVLFFLLFSGNAQAACSGGFDGAGSAFESCSEMGELGDLIYKRDDTGKVLGRRNDAEIREYLISVVEKRLENRGVTMKNSEGQTNIVIDDEKVSFDLYYLNGDLMYNYTVDLEKGIPENEKELISSRERYKARKEEYKALRKEYMDEIEALGEKIKAEEANAKAAEEE